MQLGSWYAPVMAIFIFMFAFSSIVGNYYYGEINIAHLTKKPYLLKHLPRICSYHGLLRFHRVSLNLVWNLADLFMAFMNTKLNVAVLLLLVETM